MNVVEVVVRYSSGAYNTNRVRKLSASSTMSAQAAVERLADKMFGPAVLAVTQTREPVHLVSHWTITADATANAWCTVGGEIFFGHRVPDGAHQFAQGPERALRLVVGNLARLHRVQEGVLLVPGMPEARNEREAMLDLHLWVNKLAVENHNPGRLGVVFGRQWEQ